MLAASLKAVTAFAATFIATITVMLQDRTSLEGMGLTEWATVVVAALAVSVLTWLVPNYGYAPRNPPAG